MCVCVCFSSQRGGRKNKTLSLSDYFLFSLFFPPCRTNAKNQNTQPINQIIVGGSAAKSD